MTKSSLRLTWTLIILLLALVTTSCGGGAPVEKLAITVMADASNVIVENTVQLEATLQGPGAATATITWSANPESGTFTPDRGRNVSWTAPEQAGTYELSAATTIDGVTSTGSVTITVEDPCAGIESCSLIRTLADLQAMKDDLSGYHIVVNDIDASDTKNWIGVANDGFEPVGTKANPFTGTLDGQTHSIDGLHIDQTICEDPDGCSLGLFGFTASTAEILEVNLTAIDITGVSDLGGLVGLNEGVIKNSSVSGELVGTGYVGGLVGRNLGRIINSSSAASTESGSTGLAVAGGLVAENVGRITNSHSTGAVKFARAAGGLVGINTVNHATSVSGIIESSSSSSTVRGGDYVGGLIGSNETSAVVTGSHSSGNVEGGRYAGGLSGTNFSSTITKSYSTGNVTGLEFVGGLVGRNQNGSITGSHSASNVTSTDPDGNVGGLVGHNGNDSTGTIKDSYSTGTVTGLDMIGGLVGRNQGGSITTSYSTAAVMTESADSDIGGLVGYNEGEISNSYASGSADGVENVGGLVGRHVDGSVTNSYSTSFVQATGSAGGLIGGTGGAVIDSYWDIETSNQATSSGTGAEGKPTIEMQTSSTFVTWSPSIWSTETGAYPDLHSNPRP